MRLDLVLDLSPLQVDLLQLRLQLQQAGRGGVCGGGGGGGGG